MDAPYPLEAAPSVRTRPRLAALRRAWPLALALIVIGVILSGLLFSKHGRPALVAGVMLPDMLVDLPVRPVTWLTPDPLVERTTIDYGSGSIVADIYRPPGDEARAAIVFSMGAPPLDLDDSRLVKLGEDAARAGLVMLVPFSERLDAERIEPEEVDALVGLFQYLEEQPYVDPERIGYIGVSVGGSLALLAAADERIAERVDYVVTFGGYFDALDTLTAIGARRVSYNGLDEAWEPDDHTVEVMAIQIIDELRNPTDRALLWDAFVYREPLRESEIASLGPEGRAAYDFLSGRDPGRVRDLIAQLPAPTIAKLDKLSPNRVIDDVGGELYIIHDRGDAFIPYVESRRMRDALTGRPGVHFTEVSLFEHVEPRLSRGGDVIVLDGAKLYFHLYQLLLRLL